MVRNAGLPNITGQLNCVASFKSSVGNAGFSSANGAFSIANEHRDGYGVSGHLDGPTYSNATFNASRSNAIYGASSTVQPPALQLIAQIKF